VGWWNAKNMVMVGYEMKNWFRNRTRVQDIVKEQNNYGGRE
jgi:hypothetical protein